MDDCISRQQAIEVLRNRWLKTRNYEGIGEDIAEECEIYLKTLPSVQPERKTGHWILDRSGAYCCSKCMEPCASYAMMKPRDKFCKMCGSRNEVME